MEKLRAGMHRRLLSCGECREDATVASNALQSAMVVSGKVDRFANSRQISEKNCWTLKQMDLRIRKLESMLRATKRILFAIYVHAYYTNGQVAYPRRDDVYLYDKMLLTYYIMIIATRLQYKLLKYSKLYNTSENLNYKVCAKFQSPGDR